MRRTLQVVAALGVVIAVLVAGTLVELNRRARNVWEQTKQDLQEGGEKLDASSFIPAPIPDSDNVAMAPFFAPVIEALGRDTGTKEPADLVRLKEVDVNTIATSERPLPRHGSWQVGRTEVPNKMAMSPAEVLEALKRFEPSLQEFEKAMERPQCRFPLRYEKTFAMAIPHTAVLVRLGRVLHERAVDELLVGNADGALRDALLVERAANCLRNESVLISHLVRLVLLDQFLDVVWRGTADHRWNEAQLQSLTARLRTLNILPDHERVVRGERAFLNEYCDDLRRSNRKLVDSSLLTTGVEDTRPRQTLWTIRFLPRTAFLYQNQAEANRWIQDLFLPVVDPGTRRVYPRRQIAANEIVRNMPTTWRNLLAKIVLPVYSNIAMRTAVIEVGIRQAQVACALERYRLRSGRYPEDLRRLVPDFLEADMPDLFGEQVLQYRLHGEHDYILSSIGWNSVDDSGEVAARANNPYRRDDERGDWVWFGSTAP